jgi:hypothetical protein
MTALILTSTSPSSLEKGALATPPTDPTDKSAVEHGGVPISHYLFVEPLHTGTGCKLDNTSSVWQQVCHTMSGPGGQIVMSQRYRRRIPSIQYFADKRERVANKGNSERRKGFGLKTGVNRGSAKALWCLLAIDILLGQVRSAEESNSLHSSSTGLLKEVPCSGPTICRVCPRSHKDWDMIVPLALLDIEFDLDFGPKAFDTLLLVP